jgi:hypothetical protein
MLIKGGRDRLGLIIKENNKFTHKWRNVSRD